MNATRENLIESPSIALDAVKELMRRDATFGCERVEAGWLIVIFDEGRSYADDSAGQPSETVFEGHLGKVLAARQADRQRPDVPDDATTVMEDSQR